METTDKVSDKSMESGNKPAEKKGFFKSFVDNVKEGATFVGEKVAETSAKAYVASTELASEASEKIHDYTEKQTLHKEEHKIEARQIAIKHQFGVVAFDHYIETETLHKPFLTSEPVNVLVEEYKSNIARLEAITIELKELEDH